MTFNSAGESLLPPALPRFVSVRELAKHMLRNEFTIYHWIKEAPDRLPTVTRVHGRVLFLESDVRAWFESHQAQFAYQEVQHAPVQAQSPKRRRGRPSKVEPTSGREASLQRTHQ